MPKMAVVLPAQLAKTLNKSLARALFQATTSLKNQKSKRD
jgi:hypothetical protein